MYAIDLILKRTMPSERQSAEWGVRSLKAPFGRLRLPLPIDSYRRRRILQVCVHLLNIRTRSVGLKQLRSTYASSQQDPNTWIQRMISAHDDVPL